MQNEILVWELCRGNEILGTLLSAGRGQSPWIDCVFEPARKLYRTKNYRDYNRLFHEYTLVKMLLGYDYNTWLATGPIAPDSSATEERDILEKQRIDLLQSIQSLQFTLVPISPTVQLGKVTEIYAHGRHVMIVADFSDAPKNYWW